MTKLSDERLHQAHQRQKREQRLTDTEKKQLHHTLFKSRHIKQAWWMRTQWLMACAAVFVLGAISWQQYHGPAPSTYTLASYQRIEIYDLQGSEQRVRVSAVVPRKIRNIEDAERQLSAQLQRQQLAYGAAIEGENQRIARVVHLDDDWLLADCQEQVLLALSAPLLARLKTPARMPEKDMLMQLEFNTQGQLVAVRGAPSQSCG